MPFNVSGAPRPVKNIHTFRVIDQLKVVLSGSLGGTPSAQGVGTTFNKSNTLAMVRFCLPEGVIVLFYKA
jgi:hypothetical protein